MFTVFILSPHYNRNYWFPSVQNLLPKPSRGLFKKGGSINSGVEKNKTNKKTNSASEPELGNLSVQFPIYDRELVLLILSMLYLRYCNYTQTPSMAHPWQHQVDGREPSTCLCWIGAFIAITWLSAQMFSATVDEDRMSEWVNICLTMCDMIYFSFAVNQTFFTTTNSTSLSTHHLWLSLHITSQQYADKVCIFHLLLLTFWRGGGWGILFFPY